MTSVPVKNILLVEDDKDISRAVKKWLEENGFSVRCVFNGEEALSAANDEFDANLILLDLMMPVMDGFEFCRQKLFHPKFKNVPVVVMSADGNVKTKKDLTQAQAYIKKPLDIFVLLDTVRKYAQ